MTPTAPGWYADPADAYAATVRWWDGLRWTQHVQPAVYGAPVLPSVGPPVPPELAEPAKRTFFEANLFSCIIAALAVVWVLNYYVNRSVLVGLLPLWLTYWAAKRKEPLGVPAGILAGVVIFVSFFYVWQHGGL
jgi:Protein of unknown function (DUF2510)